VTTSIYTAISTTLTDVTRFSSDNSLRTASAGVPWAPCHPHPQLCGCDIKLLGAHFANAMHLATAARACLMLDIDHHLIARQMRRQRTVIAGRASAMGSGFGAISRFSRLLSRPMLSKRKVT
jgi:hypothetical protein